MQPPDLVRTDPPLAALAEALAPRYRLEEPIGRGGMATVYRAHDLRHDRIVAIKVLRADLLQAGKETTRFLREIRIAAQLSHPSILPVHDSGESAGQLWFVMPFVRGESLRQRLAREGRLPLEEAVAIGRTVALALDYAHRQNVVHRDIKPENILLYEGQAVVADFGIARAISAAASEHVTERGLAIGTPPYMSPEQIGGDQQLDGRADIYALACVMHEMLTGVSPFEGPGTRPILLRHLNDPPPPVRAARPTVRASVEQALLRAMAKDPADRFETAAAFADALVAPHTAPPPVERGNRCLAVLPFANVNGDQAMDYLSDGITEELINALANVEGLQVPSRSAVYRFKGAPEGAREIGERLDVPLVLEGSVRSAGDRIRVTAQLTDVAEGRMLWSQRFDRQAGDLLALEDDLAQTIVSVLRSRFLGGLPDPTPRRYTENVEAYNLYLKGRYAWNLRNQASTREAIRYFEAAIAADPSFALAYTGLSDSYALQVDYRGAPVAEGMRRARTEAARALALDESLAEAHTSLGWVTFIHDWNWEKAAYHYSRAIALNPHYATARQWHAWFLMAMGRTDEALAEGLLAEQLDPANQLFHGSLGWLYQYARQWDESVLRLRRAVTLNPGNDENVCALGLSLMEMGDYDEAERVLREAEAMATANFRAFATLGRLAARRGHRAEAESRLRQLEAIARERYVSPVDFVRLHIGLGNADAAFTAIEDAYAERRGWLTYLRVDPLLDPLRGDPRYQYWLHRMLLD